MALRLIEVSIPTATAGRLQAALAEHDTLGVWIVAVGEERALARILVPTGQTEAISDLLSDQFSIDPDFRVMLFSVEATLPLPEQASQPSPEQAGTDAAQQEQEQARQQRISREELYHDIAQGADLSRTYLVTVVLSTVVAAVGLLGDNVAVIIGAMVIAPLLGPNVALALASTLADIDLAKRSARTLLAGIGTALALALPIGFLGATDPTVPEIAARTQVGLADIVLALAAGSAGALAFTAGIPAGVIGVMVAVALLPPLVVVGLLLGAGEGGLALNALLLFTANVACVNLAGVVTFLVQRIRPRAWWETERAERATRVAMLLWGATLALLLGIILLTSV